MHIFITSCSCWLFLYTVCLSTILSHYTQTTESARTIYCVSRAKMPIMVTSWQWKGRPYLECCLCPMTVTCFIQLKLNTAPFSRDSPNRILHYQVMGQQSRAVLGQPLLTSWHKYRQWIWLKPLIFFSGSSPSLGTQPCEDGALMQLPGTTSQTNLASVSASHLLTQRTRRSSNASRILRRQVCTNRDLECSDL